MAQVARIVTVKKRDTMESCITILCVVLLFGTSILTIASARHSAMENQAGRDWFNELYAVCPLFESARAEPICLSPIWKPALLPPRPGEFLLSVLLGCGIEFHEQLIRDFHMSPSDVVHHVFRTLSSSEDGGYCGVRETPGNQ